MHDRTKISGLKDRAVSLHRQGAYEAAASICRTILVAAPGDFDSLHILGAIALQRNEGEDPLPHFQHAIRGNPHVAGYYANFAVLLMERGYYPAALRSTLTALLLDPAHPSALVSHSSALRETDHPEAGRTFARRAIALKPGHSMAYTALAQSQAALGDHRQAIETLKNAVALEPQNPRAWFVSGQLSSILGLNDTERKAAKAVRLRPAHPYYLASLVAVHRFTEQDEWLELLEAALEAAEVREDEIALPPLYFALGEAYSGLGEKQRGFDYYLKGNAAKRRRITYDETVTLPMFHHIRQVFSADMIRERQGLGDPSPTPIFIIGLPRSGTSLIEQVLASHSGVHGAGEINNLTKALDRLDVSGRLTFPAKAADYTTAQLSRLGADYVGEIRALAPQASHITDKMPGNLPFAGLIHLALPKAKIILLRRDAVDVCLSCFSINFAGALSYTYDLGELGRFAYSSLQFMDHWEKVIPADRLLSLRYEDFVADQEGQTRRLLDFCGLPWEEACLSFHRTQRAVVTASVSQVRQPVYKSAVGRWRPDDATIKPLLDALQGQGAVPVGMEGDAAYSVAVRCFREGKRREADRLLRCSLVCDPACADALNLTGVGAHMVGDQENGRRFTGRAARVVPGKPDYRVNLAAAQEAAGRHDEALGSSRMALCLQPDIAGAWYNLGNAARSAGRPDQAAKAYRRTIRLQPDHADAHKELGIALLDREEYAAALDVLSIALRMRPGDLASQFRRGLALAALERHEEALKAFETSLVLDPAFTVAMIPKARLHLHDGEEGSLLWARRALSVDPSMAEAWLQIAESKTFTPGDPDIAPMESLLAEKQRKQAGWVERALLHFSLAKAYLESGGSDRVFAHLDEGNRLKRASYTYDVTAEQRAMQVIEQVLSAPVIARFAERGDPSELPVFVLGMPRSGTSLTEQILASHPQVHGAGEVMTMANILRRIAGPASYADLLSETEAGSAFLRQVGQAYVEEISALAPPGKTRIVDKLPGNVRLAGLIHLALPEARIIHCRRDPIDTCLSCYTKYFAGALDYAYDLRELGLYYRAYDRLADHWRRVLPADRYIEVQYEDLIGSLETEAPRLVAFCGLAWDESCLDFHNTRRQVRTASYRQVRKPIYRSSVRRWEAYADHLVPLIEALKS